MPTSPCPRPHRLFLIQIPHPHPPRLHLPIRQRAAGDNSQPGFFVSMPFFTQNATPRSSKRGKRVAFFAFSGISARFCARGGLMRLSSVSFCRIIGICSKSLAANAERQSPPDANRISRRRTGSQAARNPASSSKSPPEPLAAPIEFAVFHCSRSRSSQSPAPTVHPGLSTRPFALSTRLFVLVVFLGRAPWPCSLTARPGRAPRPSTPSSRFGHLPRTFVSIACLGLSS